MKRIQSMFATVAGIALFVMMWLTVIDVIGRKFFDSPLTGAVELTELFMLLTIFVALPLTSWAGEHIVFDLLDRVLPASVLRWQRVISQVITTAMMTGAAWIVFVRAQRTLEYGDITSQLAIPLGGFHALIAAMLLLTAGVHAYLAVDEVRRST